MERKINMGHSVKTIERPLDYKLQLHIFETDEDYARGSILILHGMAEHYERYFGFIDALNNVGYDVYIYNHRGHGTDLKEKELGFFAKKNGDEVVIEDAVAVMKYVYENKRSERCAIFGHSMGSLITRNVIQRFDKMDCALICGTGFMSDAICKTGMFVSNVISFFYGPEHKSPLMKKLTFNKDYKKNCTRTPNDWLTKDEKIVDAYNNDPYCGFLCSSSFYHDLISITYKACHNIEKTRHDMPILIASGADDPVGAFGKGIEQLYNKYKELGFKSVSMKLYDTDRHELLNETDKDRVISDFIKFFESNL